MFCRWRLQTSVTHWKTVLHGILTYMLCHTIIITRGLLSRRGSCKGNVLHEVTRAVTKLLESVYWYVHDHNKGNRIKWYNVNFPPYDTEILNG